MRAIVIYFSQTGNTRKSAMDIAHKLKLETYEIKSINEDPEADFDGYSDFLIGTPIIDGGLPPLVENFLTRLDFRGRRLYFFYTMGGYLGTIDYQVHEICTGASIKTPLRLKFIESHCDDYDNAISEWTEYIKRDMGLF